MPYPDKRMIADEIAAAMATLRYMPGENPGRLKAVWPETLNTDRENWWASVTAVNVNRYQPTPEDIARMDVVLFQWFPLLTAYERVLVSARGAGCSWRRMVKVCQHLKSRSHVGHKTNWRLAIQRLARRIQKGAEK